jgi:DNA gyrase subunit A
MGVREIMGEWLAFRRECVRRRVFFELARKRDKLHLLLGLAKILLDIDKAVRIVRETEEEAEVVPNLMIGFGIDKIQADYVAEIRLRHLNREYILNRTKETDSLKAEIDELQSVLDHSKKVDAIIAAELKDIIKKHGQPRKSMLYYPTDEDEEPVTEEVPDYPVHLFFSKEGYLKKITPQSLRMSAEQKLKEGDEIAQSFETSNAAQLLFFTNRQQVYKADAADFTETKASAMGDYIPVKLGMEEGEQIVYLVVTKDYEGWMLFLFENGKAGKVELSGYQTKTKRKKLLAAYYDKSPLAAMYHIREDCEFLLRATNNRSLIFHSGALAPKTTKNTQGVQVMSLRNGLSILLAAPFMEGTLANSHRFRTKTLPASGSFPRPEDEGEQLTL